MQKVKISKRVGRQLYRSSPTILTVVASIGVVTTTITAVRATPKAIKMLKEAESEKGENLTKLEIIRAAGPTYIPSVLLGVSTIACIFGANTLNQKKQASLMSAYAMLNESYKQYRKAAKTVYGEDADDKIHAEMAKDALVSTYDWGYQVYNMDMDSDSERLLFYDLASKKYFRTTMAAVLNAQYHVNRNLSIRGDCSLNEYLSFLGLDEVEGGDTIGWDICYMIERSYERWAVDEILLTIMDHPLTEADFVIEGFILKMEFFLHMSGNQANNLIFQVAENTAEALLGLIL